MPICVTDRPTVQRLTCPVTVCHVPAVPELITESVHVWQQSGVTDASSMEYLRSLLSPEELQRASRFRFDRDRGTFIQGRGWLRTLAGAYTKTAPKELAFRHSARGKPLLTDPSLTDLHFNVSHSGEMILLAFARGRRLGVDIELIRGDFSISEIAERFFSYSERECLRNLSAADQHLAFFRCWTRKEAYIKAIGDGLSLPLDQFDVSLASNEPARLLQTRPDPAEVGRWIMWDLDVGDRYAGALVVERDRPLLG